MNNILVVGAGIAGCVAANILSVNHNVDIIDKRSHIGGNLYDEFTDNLNYKQYYGPHIFHTDNVNVWRFLSKFTKWKSYIHCVVAMVDGDLVELPVNLNTLCKLFPKSYVEYITNKTDLYGKHIPIDVFRMMCDDPIFKIVGNGVYEKIYKNYTSKQWGEFIPDNIFNRVKINLDMDKQYFDDRYQAIPVNGFTHMCEQMLQCENITLMLNTHYNDKMCDQYDLIFYSGGLDGLMNYKYGVLPYRSIKIEFDIDEKYKHASHAVVNYPNNYDFTRITNYSNFLNNKPYWISYEYPCGYNKGDEPYYVVETEFSKKMYQKYLQCLPKNIIPIGRLGKYRYFDIDGVVEDTINIVNQYI